MEKNMELLWFRISEYIKARKIEDWKGLRKKLLKEIKRKTGFDVMPSIYRVTATDVPVDFSIIREKPAWI